MIFFHLVIRWVYVQKNHKNLPSSFSMGINGIMIMHHNIRLVSLFVSIGNFIIYVHTLFCVFTLGFCSAAINLIQGMHIYNYHAIESYKH